MFRPIIVACLLLLAACQFNTAPQPTALALLPIRLISFWEAQRGNLASGDEIQPWQFIAQAGDTIRIRAISPVNIRLTLQAEGGSVLAQGVGQLEAALPAAGVFTVLLQAESAGQYEIGLSYTDRPNPTEPTRTPLPVTVAVPTPTPPYDAHLGTFISAIQSGESRVGAFAAPEERHLYTLEGAVGQIVAVQMARTSGTVDPLISLYAPSGAQIATDDNSGGGTLALLRNIRLNETGVYTIQAWGRGFAGGYQLNLLTSAQPIPVTPTFVFQPSATPIAEVLTPTLGPAVNGANLYDHIPVIGQIERGGDFDRYPFQAGAGQLITVGARPVEGSRLRPRLEVYDPSGVLIATGTPDEDGVLIAALPVAETDTYVVFISGEGDTTGGYIIAYGVGASNEETLRGLSAPDQTYDSQITRRGLRDSWSLDLNPEDVISAEVRSLTPGFQPLLELRAPDGSTVALNTGSSEAVIASARIPLAGRYRLEVSATGAATTGAYTLAWHYINLSPSPTPIPGIIPILTYQDTIPDQAYQFYPFYAQAGTQIQIQVIALSGTAFDPVAALLAPDGSIIAQGDDSQGDLNPRFTATLPADGSYSVRVNGYLSSGAFLLLVEALYSRKP